MKEDTLKNELRADGYSKEEQYFYELNLILKRKAADNQIRASKDETAPTDAINQPLSSDNRIRERAIQRWETDGGSIKKSKKP